MKNLINDIRHWFVRHHTYQLNVLVLSFIIGILVGVATSLMKTGVVFLREEVEAISSLSLVQVLYFVLPIIGILLTIGFLKYVVKDDVRHGIPRILYVLARKEEMKKHKVFSSFVGGAITAGFGGSAGLESPIISTGSAIGSYLGHLFKMDYKTTSLLMGCGAAAAIASIFYTPIAAVIFGVEVLMLDLSTSSIIPLLVTATTGAIIANQLMPSEIIFLFPTETSATLTDLPFIIALGILTGLISVYFNRMNFWIQQGFKRFKKRSHARWVGLSVLGLLILLFPPLYGEGYVALKSLILNGPGDIMKNSLFEPLSNSYWFLIIFLSAISLIKVISTTLTIEGGGIGGIFAPAVFTGGVGGYTFASVANKLLPVNLSEENYAVVGMSGVLGGVLHAPLTAIFFAAEITEGYKLMLPLMLVAAIAFITNRIIDSHSIFSRQLEDQGVRLSHNKDHNVLTLLSVAKVIDKDFLTIGPDANLKELTSLIAKARRNIFPVVDDDNNFLGLIAMDDVREDMFDKSKYEQSIQKYIIQPIDYVSTTSTMQEVMKKFNETSYYNLLVIDKGKYIGFISRSNTFTAYRKMLLDISFD